MNRFASLVSLVVLVSSPVFARAQGPAAEEAVVRKQLAAWIDAWNRGDGLAVAAFYTEDAVRLFPHGATRTGRAQIAEVYAAAFAAPVRDGVERKLAMTTVHSIRLLRPDVASVDYEYRATGLPMLPELEVAGRTTLVMVKQDGEWLRSVQSNWIPIGPDCYRQCARD